MADTTSIVLGGLFNAGFAVFHLLFWRLFDWKNDLASLTFINRQVVQVLNLSLTFALVIFAYLSLFHTAELLGTSLGRAVLLLIALFWFLRAAEQLYFFRLRRPVSIAFFGVFLMGGLLYGVPWIA